MARKNTARLDESTNEEDTPKVPVSGIGFELDSEDSPSLGSSIQAWIQANNLDGASINGYLYRRDATGKRWLAHRFKDEIPDPADVGSMFGPGQYALHIQVGKRSTTAHINIGPEFTRQVSEGPQQAGMVPVTVNMPPQYQTSPMESIQASFSLLKELMGIMKPMFEIQSKGAVQDMPGLMSGTVEMVNEIMKKSMRQSMELVGEIQRQQIGMVRPEVKESDIEPQSSFMDKWLPLIERFIPVLTGPGPAAQLTADMIRGTAEYQQIVADRNQLATAVTALEKSFGPEKVKKALQRLNVIPGDVNPEPQNPPHED